MEIHLFTLLLSKIKKTTLATYINQGLIPSHYLTDHPEKSLAAYLFYYIRTKVHIEASLRNREPFASFLELLGIVMEK